MQDQYRPEYSPSPRPVFPPVYTAYPWASPFVYTPVHRSASLPTGSRRVHSAKQANGHARTKVKATRTRHDAAHAEAAARPTYLGCPTYAYATPGYAYPSLAASPAVSYRDPMATPVAGNIILNNPQNCNFYQSPELGHGSLYGSPPTMWTAAPSYITLSPPAPPYMELGKPEDIPADKWENSKGGYLYDNRKSPVEVNSCHSVLDVHPILSHVSDFPLIVDLCLRPEDITMIDSPGTRWCFSEEGEAARSQPAVLPRVTRLRLGSTKMPRLINVMNPLGVTVSSDCSQRFISHTFTSGRRRHQRVVQSFQS